MAKIQAWYQIQFYLIHDILVIICKKFQYVDNKAKTIQDKKKTDNMQNNSRIRT